MACPMLPNGRPAMLVSDAMSLEQGGPTEVQERGKIAAWYF